MLWHLALEKRVADQDQFGQVLATAGVPEAIKLVVWDLDDTFWKGTLSEGPVTVVSENVAIVKSLSACGILNSICSKNDFTAAQAELKRLGLWDYFIFPHIAFTPKGEMVGEIIEAVQLRAPSVLFIDDNLANLYEAMHYNAGLQIATPHILATLLDDPRCKGAPDPALERLAQYKVLEQKWLDRGTAGGDNIAFLRESQIRISFHYDVLEQFPRIHALVNRANQLNFTKRRWPEGLAEASTDAQEEFGAVFNSHWGYVKVADRYGNYGICGFFMTRYTRARHFLFSCRIMNMGVEQFVWHKLGKPEVDSRGEVASTLGDLPDWITLTEDVDDAEGPAVQPGVVRPLICLRGACDLSMMAHYLRTKFETVEEYQYPCEGWVVHRTAREIALSDEIGTPAIQGLLAEIPRVPPERFESAVNTGVADIYVLSFSSEIFGGLKRSRSTGAVLPLFLEGIGSRPYCDFSYEQMSEKQGKTHLTPETWAYLQNEYEAVPFLDEALLTADLHRFFKKLTGKLVIILKLNSSVGAGKWHLDSYGRINDIVLPVAKAYNCRIVDMAEFVRTTDDLVDANDPGVHYRRDIYRNLAMKVEELVEKYKGPMRGTAAVPPRTIPDSTADMKLSQVSPAAASIRSGQNISERGTGNIIDIDKSATIKAPIRVHGDHNRLYIGQNVIVDGTILEIVGDNCSIVLYDDVVWRGIIRCRHDAAHLAIGSKTTSMHAIVTLHEAGSITIGEDCMLSGDIRMDVSDMHSITDRATGTRINSARDIVIGDHVWLGHGVMVLKGAHIGSGSVVGAKSLVSGVIPQNVVVAGVPARVIRENVDWNRKRL